MNIFLTFRENLLEPNTGQGSIYGVVPAANEPFPYKNSNLLYYGNEKPYEIADTFASDSTEEDVHYYAVIGVPSDFDCIILIVDLSNGAVKGFDRRTHSVIDGKSYGMGSIIEGVNENTTIEDLSFAVSAWNKVVSSIPRETGGVTIPWDGKGYKPREFHFYVEAGDARDTDRLIRLCQAAKIFYIDFRPSGGRFEIIRPARGQLEKVIHEGWAVYKDWSIAT